LLTDHVGPCFEAPEVPLSRLLTERGPEDWGSPASPDYERYFALENSDPPRPKGQRPQAKGSVESFHTPLLPEGYRLPFRKKIDTSLAELQAELDAWLRAYTEARVPPGRGGDGRTPRQPFLDPIALAKEKLLAA
jgi:hypothetical protein